MLMYEGAEKHETSSGSKNATVPTNITSNWNSGVLTSNETTGTLPEIYGPQTAIISGTRMGDAEDFYYDRTRDSEFLTNDERHSVGGNVEMVSDIYKSRQQTIFQNPNKRRELLNDDIENKQNANIFPYFLTPSSGLETAKYDYQIIPNDERYPISSKLEDKLMKARAQFGLQVHGDNNIARAVKFYMYNRFKVPDTNLAHTKSITHIFFTRPDLNLLTHCTNNLTANRQTLSHTDTSMMWFLRPELFKLLTDRERAGDDNNFNFLLSNQVNSFTFKDEELSTFDVGKSWNEHSVPYGDTFNGKQSGDFTCTFTETSDYSIIILMKLWMTYISNVANGAWKPSYNLFKGDSSVSRNIEGSHIYRKELDYAASAYVFKCGPDGEDVLYWTKYYGIFPTNSGADILDWNINNPTSIGNPNIKFKYFCKTDFSPDAIIEFNRDAAICGRVVSENSFNCNFGQSSRPFVGAPFIEITVNNPTLVERGVNYNAPETHIRLKFKKTSDDRLTDDLLYRYNLSSKIRN